MKYSCNGCKYSPYNVKNYQCVSCGKYVLSEDGDGSVYIYNNWTAKEDNIEMVLIKKRVGHSYINKNLIRLKGDETKCQMKRK